MDLSLRLPVAGLFAVPLMATTNRVNEEDEAQVSRKLSLLMVALLLPLGALLEEPHILPLDIFIIYI